MLDVEFAIATIVTVFDDQVGIAEVSQAGNDTIAYLLPILLDNDPFITLFFVEVEIEVFNEVFGQVVTQERNVVV